MPVDGWSIVDQHDKSRRETCMYPCNIWGHVSLNQTTRRVHWAISGSADAYYEHHAGIIMIGTIEITAAGTTKARAREAAMQTAQELIEYIVDNLTALGMEL